MLFEACRLFGETLFARRVDMPMKRHRMPINPCQRCGACCAVYDVRFPCFRVRHSGKGRACDEALALSSHFNSFGMPDQRQSKVDTVTAR